MLGLGIDLLEVARMERALSNPRFALRVFTPAERRRIDEAGTCASQRAAAMFAAKEAVAKALGTGFSGGITLCDIVILRDEGGPPQCRLAGKALERLQAMGGTRVMISITHERSMAAAVAVAT